MKPLSIGIFTYSTKPRGSVVHAAALAEALVELGHDATLYALDKDGGGFYRSLRAPLRLMPAQPARTGTDALIAQRIQEVAAYCAGMAEGVQSRHDVVHAQDCLVASGLLRARPAGARVCRTIHHVESFESAFLEACQERSIRQADLCLSVSRLTQADVRATYQRDSLLVPNGVDVARFGPCTLAQRASMRARLGVPAGVPLVLSVGGVEPRKNSLRMLQAFITLQERVPEARWLIAGGASIFEHEAHKAAFETQLAAAPETLRARILRVGVLPDDWMPDLYGCADVLLHASLHEGFGLCVLEALASGTSVVVSRGAPFDEFVDDDCAFRVDPHSVQSVTAGLLAALHEGARAARREAARRRAEAHSWRRSAELHVLAYRAELDTSRALSPTPLPS